MLSIVTLLIALATQIGYTIFCIIKNKPQLRLKNIIRTSAFVFFSLLLILRVYQWGFRWIPLFLVLSIFQIISIIYFFRKPKIEKPFKKSRAIISCIFGMLLLTVCILPSIVFPQQKQIKPTGEFEVATTMYTYTDSSRLETFTNSGENRNVTVEFWFPQDATGTYPLIIFTHGLYGVALSNSSTYNELASNGYVVCSISHTYLSMYTKDANENIIMIDNKYMQEASILNSGIADHNMIYTTFQKLLKTRTDDVSFALDTILANANDNTDQVYQLINTSEIGLFGHSMGGATVTTVARERGDIGAVANLDAPLIGELLGFENGEIMLRDDVYPKPLLNLYSDDLWGKMDEDPIYAGNVKILSDTPQDIYNVHFNGAKHLSFTDLSLLSPIISNSLQGGKADIDKYYCIETMNGIILDFFDCYLKGDGAFTTSDSY